MSTQQLEPVIRDIAAVLGNWGPETPMSTIRSDSDKLFCATKFTVGASAEAVNAGGVKAEWITAPGALNDRVILYLHGGGYILGSINSHRDLCERLSRAAKARVLALDYRLAPEHPFPAAVEDAVAAYRWLLKQNISPKHVAIAGDSAGGGLSLATLVALKQAGDPLPACVALMSPWVDLECTGESMTTKDAEDPLVRKPMAAGMAATYLPSGDLRNPLASPLHAALDGLPPLMIHVGSRETLLDDSVRIAAKARKAGVDVQLKQWQGQIHVFQLFASRVDEGEASIHELGAFIHGRIN